MKGLMLKKKAANLLRMVTIILKPRNQHQRKRLHRVKLLENQIKGHSQTILLANTIQLLQAKCMEIRLLLLPVGDRIFEKQLVLLEFLLILVKA